MGNELIKHSFDDISVRVDLVIEHCRELQAENKELLSKVSRLEAELKDKIETEESFVEQEAMVESNIQGLLNKLDSFSETLTGPVTSDV